MEGVPNWKLASKNQHLMAHKKKLSAWSCQPSKILLSLLLYPNSGGYFPMLANFDLRPQGHQIWVLDDP